MLSIRERNGEGRFRVLFLFFPHFLQFHFKISSKLSAPSLVGLLHPLCPSGLRLPASINKGDEQGSVALLLGRPWQLAGSRLFAFSLSPWLPASPKDTTLPVYSLPAWSFLKHPSLKSPDLFSALLNKSLEILLTHASVPGLLRTLDAILETC